MKIFIRGIVIFLILAIGLGAVASYLKIPLGNDFYWDHHGVFFLIAITLFPRLTLLFSSVPFGGFFWWLGFFFAPRLLVASLATLHYWNQNPLLVVIAWVVALGGESSEKAVTIQTSRRHMASRRGFENAKWVKNES